MTSRERVVAVFNHKTPDRVPFYEVLIDAEMVEELMGIKKSSWQLEPHQMVELAKKMHHDAVVFPFVYKPRHIFQNVFVDIESIEYPYEWMEAQLKRFEKLVNCCRENDIAVIPYTHGCFDIVYEVMGFEHYMITLMDDYEYVERLTEYFAVFTKRLLEKILPYRPDAVFIGDDICYNSGLMINKETFLNLWYDREKEIVSMIKKQGIPVEFHTDGKVDFVIDYLIDIGVDLLNPIDANCNDIFEVKEKYGNRIALRGNVDVSGALYYGPYEKVYAEASEKIKRLKDGGNYVVSTSHSITPGIKFENYKAIFDALDKNGFYI